MSRRRTTASSRARSPQESHSGQSATTRLQDILESAPIGIALVSPEGRLLQANRALAHLTGLAGPDLARRYLVGLVHEDDRKAIETLLGHTFRGTAPSGKVQARYLRSDGEVLWAATTVSVIREGRGSPTRGLVMIENITELKRVENRQAMQLAVSQVMAESATLGDAAPRLLGTVAEMTQWDLGVLWQRDREASTLRRVTLWARPGLLETGTGTADPAFPAGVGPAGRGWADGQARWIPELGVAGGDASRAALSLVGLRTGVGVPIRSGKTVHGVLELYSRYARRQDDDFLAILNAMGVRIGQFLEREQAVESARTSEERFRLAVDHAQEAMWYLDAALLVRWANRQAEQLTGRATAGLLGKPFAAIFSQQPFMREQVEALVAAEAAHEIKELEWFRPETGSVWLEFSVTPVRRGKEVVGRLLVARDRTERRQLELQLRQADKLAGLGTLVGGVAHELNNPLFIVLGHTQMAQERMQLERYTQVTENLEAIHAAASRASSIVERFLNVTRASNRPPEPCAINTVVARTLDFLQNDLTIRNISVQLELAPTLPDVLADPHDLHQVFLNLITNARQAMAEAHGRGALTVTSGVRGEHGRTWVEVRVIDDGPGIKPEHLPQIFDPFFTTKPVGQGTGLGLPICQRIINQFGGTLTCESAFGQGATFTIRLPAADPDA